MSWHVRVVPNRYADSVRLMGVAERVRRREGVDRCELLSGTPANLEALEELGAVAEANPADLVIAVVADEEAAEAALEEAERGLSAVSGAGREPEAGASRPRSLATAARALAGANVALISVPGEYAVLEAQRALTAGLHVFLFSDHVGAEAELELKRRGAERGLLVMGPECGTAMLGGVGLGFANVVPEGGVGIVAAAGTGAQESACLLAAAGSGVSEIVGVGGRDLSREIGGIMFRQGMRMLGEHPGTETLLLVSKPPAPEVVAGLAGAVPAGLRVIAAFVGWEGGEAPFEVHPTLEAGALAAAGAEAAELGELEAEVDRRRERSAGRAVVGLYSGGSLAHEAATILEPQLGPLAGNVTGGEDRPPGHALYDLGESEYTRGRAHPMVDLRLRIEMLERLVEEGRAGCVLLDLVLGHGAHPDPAPELAPAIERAAETATVIARVCGTAEDPQDARRQEEALRGAGALLAPSNAAAARLAGRAVR